jgi:group I intron endonuclease
VCHRLLIRMHNGVAKQKMSFAFYRLCNRHSKTSGRAYEAAKLEVKNTLSKIHKGKTLTAEHRLQIQNRTSGEKNPMYGKKHSNDALKIMRECKLNNTNARVGVKVLDTESNIVHEFSSIKELMTHFDINRGQAEYYIYNKRPFKGFLFERSKIITRR